MLDLRTAVEAAGDLFFPRAFRSVGTILSGVWRAVACGTGGEDPEDGPVRGCECLKFLVGGF